jgi:hypothetical protein
VKKQGGWKFSRKLINEETQITAGRVENFYFRPKSIRSVKNQKSLQYFRCYFGKSIPHEFILTLSDLYKPFIK